ncbi:GNAT family N-acetyltransferase [Arthrobacter sp. MAHUQ-56]|nr:GNAT family N-acetyltransferase [Arthrobacter sp. MAHUQ-56]
MTVEFRRAVPADFAEVRRITRDAYLRAGHFAADHPYMSVLEDVEHRAEHAQVWVAEAAGKVVAAVTLTFAGQPYSEVARDGELEFRMLAVDPARQGGGVGRAVVQEITEHAQQLPGIKAISITSATFMERAHALYESLGFRRAPERDWYVPGEDVLLWVFTVELSRSADPGLRAALKRASLTGLRRHALPNYNRLSLLPIRYAVAAFRAIQVA